MLVGRPGDEGEGVNGRGRSEDRFAERRVDQPVALDRAFAREGGRHDRRREVVSRTSTVASGSVARMRAVISSEVIASPAYIARGPT